MIFQRVMKTFSFGAADTSKEIPLQFDGIVKNLHLRVPAFTNTVTVVVSIKDPAGYEFYASGSKAMGANYNLEIDYEWAEQLLTSGVYHLVVTLSGVPGGTGGEVILVPRILGL